MCVDNKRVLTFAEISVSNTDFLLGFRNNLHL